MTTFLTISGIIFWALLVLYILLRVIYGKHWFLKVSSRLFVGWRLTKNTEILLNEFQNNKVTKATLSKVAVGIFNRIIMASVPALIIASIPIILLWQQNKLIGKQNQLINFQNERIDKQTDLAELQTEKLETQNNLLEADRRSSLVFLMNHILSSIDRELKNDVGIKGKRDLSVELIGNIIALSSRLKPYRYLDGDTLISKQISPERGQLLVALVESNLDSDSYNKIFKKAVFDYAELSDTRLSNANLEGALLRNANLNNASLGNANLKFSNLENASLENASLSYTDLSAANLTKANLSKVFARNCKLIASELVFVNLKDSDLSSANLSGAFCIAANMENANLEYANISGTYFNLHSIMDNNTLEGGALGLKSPSKEWEKLDTMIREKYGWKMFRYVLDYGVNKKVAGYELEEVFAKTNLKGVNFNWTQLKYTDWQFLSDTSLYDYTQGVLDLSKMYKFDTVTIDSDSVTALLKIDTLENK